MSFIYCAARVDIERLIEERLVKKAPYYPLPYGFVRIVPGVWSDEVNWDVHRELLRDYPYPDVLNEVIAEVKRTHRLALPPPGSSTFQ